VIGEYRTGGRKILGTGIIWSIIRDQRENWIVGNQRNNHQGRGYRESEEVKVVRANDKTTPSTQTRKSDLGLPSWEDFSRVGITNKAAVPDDGLWVKGNPVGGKGECTRGWAKTFGGMGGSNENRLQSS